VRTTTRRTPAGWEMQSGPILPQAATTSRVERGHSTVLAIGPASCVKPAGWLLSHAPLDEAARNPRVPCPDPEQLDQGEPRTARGRPVCRAPALSILGRIQPAYLCCLTVIIAP
jgi:hypothetical protein